MNVKIDIHQDKFLKKYNAVDNWKVPESTKKEIKTFIDKAKLGQVNNGKKLSDRTLSKYLSLLRVNLEIINKQTSKLSKKDIEDYDKKISKKNFKSLADYKVNLKIFLNWKLGISKTEKIAGWLDTRQKNKTPDYLQEREVLKLYKKCKNNSERFLIAVLFDSGARIEEFLNLRSEDIQLPDKNENFVKITFKEEYSKTKGRVISLYWTYSLRAVKDYLDEISVRSNEPVFNKTYDAIRMFLNRLGKRVLKKEVTPHLFRHSSCTHYASKLNRQELCYRYGWTFSSDMPDIYISRSGMQNKELDEKFRSTELERLEKDFELERFETNKKLEEQDKKILELEKSMDNVCDKLTIIMNQKKYKEIVLQRSKK